MTNIILLFLILLIISYIKKGEKRMKDEKKLEEKIIENDDIKTENNNIAIEYDLSDDDKIFNEIFKFKKTRYSNYRNYPNQNSLRKIYRQKPKYIREKNYIFSDYNFDNEKIEVEKSKYDLIVEREENFFNKKPLPEIYLTDEIVLMPKNTDTLFAYWEITEETYHKITDNIFDKYPKIILKTINGNELYTITAYNNIGSMYINNVESNDDYIAYLGFIDNNGNFIEVAHSSDVNVPNDKQSNNFDVTWGFADKRYLDNKLTIDFRTISISDARLYEGFECEILDDELLFNSKNKKHLEMEENQFLGASNIGGASDKRYSSKDLIK